MTLFFRVKGRYSILTSRDPLPCQKLVFYTDFYSSTVYQLSVTM